MSFGLLVRQPDPWLPAAISCPPRRSRSEGRPCAGPGVVAFRVSSRNLMHGQVRELPGCLASLFLCLCAGPATPDDLWHLAGNGASSAAPSFTTLKGVIIGPSRGSIAALRHLLSTLHDPRCREPCKTRFRLAGCAFAGRESNPLGSDERFQLMVSPFPDLCLALRR